MALTPEQQKEIAEAVAANRARQEALTRKQRFEAGEFSIELVPADDDPQVNDPVFQKELSQFGASLRTADVPYSQLLVRFDSVDAFGYKLPEFIIAIALLGRPAIAALKDAFIAWIQVKYGRKVRLKIGEDEAEASSVAEVEELWKVAAKYRYHDQKNPERERRIKALEIQKNQIQVQMSSLQTLAALSRLRDQLLAVEEELKRLR